MKFTDEEFAILRAALLTLEREDDRSEVILLHNRIIVQAEMQRVDSETVG